MSEKSLQSQPQWVVNHVTHKNAHLEELAIVWIAVCPHFRREMDQFYWNADRADFIRWDNLPVGTIREYWESRGYVFYGRWGGEFDEHATADAPRKEDESALSLFARKIGIEEHPKFCHMLKWISWLDQNQGKSPFLLPAIAKKMNDIGWDPDVVMKWVFVALEAMYSKSPDFFLPVQRSAGLYWNILVSRWMANQFGNPAVQDELQKANDPWAVAHLLNVGRDPGVERILSFSKDLRSGRLGMVFEPHAVAVAIHNCFGDEVALEWASKTLTAVYRQTIDFVKAGEDLEQAKTYRVKIGERKIAIVVGDSDNRQFNRRARATAPNGRLAGVVVVRNSAGNVNIFTNTALKLDLSSVAALLRTEESKKRGMGIPDAARLNGENDAVCGIWFHFERGHMLLNGSTTASVPPTVLDLDTIAGIVFTGLGVEGFGSNQQRAVAPPPLAAAPASV